jgi:hypothetical protein
MLKLSFVIFAVLLATQISITRAQNLIFNPGCEDSLVNGEIPHWTEVVGTDWKQRESGNPPSYEGDYMFFAGVSSTAELLQDVDVSSYANKIDSSMQYFNFEGYVRAYQQSPPDHSRIILEYLDTLKMTKLDSIDLGEYYNTSEWVQVTDTTLAPVGTRFIRIRLISTRYNGSNNDGYYDGLSLIADMPSNIYMNEFVIPNRITLLQNFPNPFNPTTKIKYSIPQSSNVVIKVFDILGNEIETLVSEEKQKGTYEITWYAENLPSGIYFYQLQAGSFVETKKMVLMK